MSRYLQLLPVVGILFLVLAFSSDPSASADHGPPIEDTIDVVAIDTKIDGNAPSFAGNINACRDVNIGAVFDIDVIADEVPPLTNVYGAYGGLSGVAFDLVYDPAVLKITGRSNSTDLQFEGLYLDIFSDSLPDIDGSYRHDVVDLGIGPLSGSESGPGVVARLTVEAVGIGISQLQLFDFLYETDSALLFSEGGTNYFVNNTFDGEIHVGSSCDPSLDPVGGEVTITVQNSEARDLGQVAIALGGAAAVMLGVSARLRHRHND